MTYILTTQPNGLRVASESLSSMETVALAISVDVGARHETLAQHGISHLLEHMAFKGTPTRSALDIAETFDAIGGHLNAFTSHEHTVYYAKVLAHHLPIAMEVLADILQNSLFDEEELAKEKQVILQELAMHHDTPDDLVFDYFQETAYPDQSLGRSILGTAERIGHHPASAIHAFVGEHYHAQHMVVTAAGNVQHDALLKLVETHLPVVKNSSVRAPLSARYVGGESLIAKPLEQLQLVIGMPSMGVTDARYPALKLLSTLLGGGMSSRLFQEVREKRGLVYTIQTMIASYADTGVFGIYAATGASQVEELIPVMCGELLAVCGNLREDELERAKQQQVAGLRMARESTATLTEWMGRHLLQYGEYRDAAQSSRMLEAVTIADVTSLARDLFASPALTVAALGPTKKMPKIGAINERLAA